MVNTKGRMDPEDYKKEIEKSIRATLDPASFYFWYVHSDILGS